MDLELPRNLVLGLAQYLNIVCVIKIKSSAIVFKNQQFSQFYATSVGLSILSIPSFF